MEPIKRFFAGASFLVFGFVLHAANPAYESFKGTNGQVVTTPGIGAARVVIISGQNFQPGSTNLTNWANLPTNVVSGANIWTQSGGTAFPTSAGAIETTNLSAWTKLIAKGAFIAETRSRTLVAGTNTLAVLTNSYLLLDSPTNDAASVVVEIGPATSSGQLLFVVNNQTNRAFTIYDGSASGLGIVELQGNFVSTNLGGLILMNQGNWVEVGRFSPAGLSAAATINPTDNFIPMRTSATAFGDSSLVMRGAAATVTNTTAAGTAELLFQTTNQLVRLGPDGPATTFLKTSGILSLIGTNGASLTALGNNSVSLVQNTNTLWFIDQKFYPQLSNRYSLGSPTEPWKDFYVGTNSIFMGTNVYTDNGASLLRNGVAVGGGGSVPSFSDLVWTNDTSVGAIQPNGIGPNTNKIKIDVNGTLYIGGAGWDYSTGEGLNSVQTNDGVNGYISQVSIDHLSPTREGRIQLQSHVQTNSDTAFSQITQMIYDTTGQTLHTFFSARLDAGVPLVEISAFSDSFGTTLFNWKPTVPDGASAVAYTFNTFTNLSTAGSLLVRFQNDGLDHLRINPTNGLSTPAITAYGAGSAPWQFGMATNTVDVLLGATNVVEITVNGVAYLLPAKLK